MESESTQREPIKWITVKKKWGSLKFHPKNPRSYTEEDILRLAEKEEKYGQPEPVVANLNDMLIAGHRRTSVALFKNKHEEETEVRVPTRLLTEEEHEDLLISLNKESENKWDIDTLLNNWNIDYLKEQGFSDQFLHGFDIPEPKIENIDEDVADPTKPKKNKQVQCPDCGRVFEIEL